MARAIVQGGQVKWVARMEDEEDSNVTVAKWRFRGRVVATIGTVIAGIFAAVAAYYGALS